MRALPNHRRSGHDRNAGEGSAGSYDCHENRRGKAGRHRGGKQQGPRGPLPGKGGGRIKRDFDITIQLLQTKYPQGGEKMLITAITGKEVPSGGLPMDVGCVVQNIGSLVAIAEAFYEGKPLIERGLNGNWGACKTPKNILAPIGTILTNLEASFMEIDQDKLRKVIFGGPMMGTAVPSLNIPIQKTPPV